MAMPMPPSSGGGQLPGPTMPNTGAGQFPQPAGTGGEMAPVQVHRKLKGKHHAAERKRLKTKRRGKRV